MTTADVTIGRYSLRLRLALVVIVILCIAFAGMSASVYVAQSARDDAAAINLAGSLRMHSYRIALLLQEDASEARLGLALADFDAILNKPALERALRRSKGRSATRYREIMERWNARLRPLAAGATAADSIAYLDEVDAFAGEINSMVAALQSEAEARVRLLRISQAVGILLTLLLAAFALLQLRNGLIRPLERLLQTMERMSHGDRRARVDRVPNNEIGVVAQHFNSMAATVERLQFNLEAEVDVKTAALRHSNQSLELLYDLSCRLVPLELDRAHLQPLLTRACDVMRLRSAQLTMDNPRAAGNRFTVDAAYPLDANNRSLPEDRAVTLRFVLGDSDPPCGELVVVSDGGKRLSSGDRKLLEAIAERFSRAHAIARAANEQQMLALMEERTMIARELHDSLAQSLSYMNIQVVRLRSQVSDRGWTSPTVDATLDELRDGLNTAYQHLRELLSTFRLRVDEPDLGLALRNTVSEFSRRAPGLDIHLDIREGVSGLRANAGVHLLHIVREALANVVRHARAERATVSIARDLAQNRLLLKIEDDGVGIDTTTVSDNGDHYGLNIMRERALQLGGTWKVEPIGSGGTRVEVGVPF
ncbi:type IV pili methyl-accepting chemotaxis transducer N-terminal domain-containing protein [Spiribacter onubensis]|uniref:Sensor protein n=1 Tax=Spiribacter onubensis TaxID=3122420 RepID=A0ABV3SBY2_9GAMM